MKTKNILIVGAVVAFVVAILLIIAMQTGFFNSKEEKKVEDIFEAHMEAIKGNNSKLESENLLNVYGNSTENFVLNMGFSESQSIAVAKALKEFDYSIEEITSLKSDGKEIVKITYRVDSYPVVNWLNIEYMEQPEKHLTKEELDMFKDGTDEEKTKIVQKLIQLYEDNIDNIKPTKETHEINYVIDSNNNVMFAQGNSFDYLIKSVLGMASDNKID